MTPTEGPNAKCPRCQGELAYIEHYQSYYCSNCDEHFEIKPSGKTAEEPPVIQEEPPKTEAETQVKEEVIERPREIQQEPVKEISDPDEAIKDIEETLVDKERAYRKLPPPPPVYFDPITPAKEEPEEPEPEPEEPEPEPVSQEEVSTKVDELVATTSKEQTGALEGPDYQEITDQDYEDSQTERKYGVTVPQPTEEPVKKPKRVVKRYRYRTRMIKGSVLPIIFGVISLLMINSARTQFPDYYELEAMIILMGFLLGFSVISGITLLYLVKAKKSSDSGYKMNMMVGVVAYLPFIVIFLALTLFISLSTGWKFATGFFLASIFPILIITMFEATSKGKFFVKEMVNDPSWGRKLVFKR